MSEDVYEVPDSSDDGGNNHQVVREKACFRCTECGEKCAIPRGFEDVECSSESSSSYAV